MRRRRSLCFLLTIAFILAACTTQAASTGSLETAPSRKDPEGPTAVTTHKLDFPKDHRFHTNANEWVYFSGVVDTSAGKEFGVMFTIFQFSGGGDRFAYPAMLGISDPESERFYDARSSWQSATLVTTADGLPLIEAGDSVSRWHSYDDLYIASTMNTRDGTEIAVEMNMRPTQDVLIHGEDGYIPMGMGFPPATTL
jgi:hypothetical protein